MSLSIELNNAPDHVWVPGDKISGKVILKLSNDSEVDCVNIKFRGKVHSKVYTYYGQSRQTHRHQAYLFVQEVTLFRGPYTLPAREHHSWPFEFTFPSHTSLDCSGDFKSGGSSVFKSGPQALPPSVSQWATNSGGTVDYKLKAEIPRKLVSWSSENYLQFSPIRLQANPDSFPLRMTDTLMDKKYRVENDIAREPTKRESLNDMLHSNRDSKVFSFQVQLESPCVLVIGQPFQTKLKIKVMHDSSTANDNTVIPPVILRGVNGTLKSHTGVQVPGLFSDFQRSFSNDISIGGVSKLDIPLLPDETISLSEIWPSVVEAVPSTQSCRLVPSYSTYSMRREYELKFHVNVSVLDKNFEAKIKVQNVIVHSAYLETPSESIEKPTSDPPPFQHESHTSADSDHISKEAGEVGRTEPVVEVLPPYVDPSSGTSAPQPPSYGDEKTQI